MKKLVFLLGFVLIFSIPAYAHMEMMGEQKSGMKEPGMMDEGKMPMMPMCQEMMKQQMGEGQQQMPMMQMCMPMMKQMMGQGMMQQDMMRMMMDMMNMQEKMMMGIKSEEKKQMMNNMMQMKEKMHKMMDMKMGMMTGMDCPQLKCAGGWLKKAIDLHEVHIKDPKTATEASQMEMMDQMKKAYECITGEIGIPQPKEPFGKEKKKDEHGH